MRQILILRQVLTALGLVMLGLTQMATAVTPAEVLPDPAQDQRARSLYAEVRCVVCQNESIGDSQADIAADMRRDIRAQMALGKSDTDIREGLTLRYGDYVLFRPKLSAGNLILWFLPLGLVVLGAVTLGIMAKTKRQTKAYDLSDDERQKLDDLIDTP